MLITAWLVTLCVTILTVIFAHEFCFQNNRSHSTNFTSVCLNVRSIVNKEHYNLFESWIQSLKFLPDIIAINETWEKKSSFGQFRNLQL